MADVTPTQLVQELCAAGQSALLATDYRAAEDYLAAAERLAWEAGDYDALSRLYMPLQEARRQRRQFAGDGPFVIRLARDADDRIDVVALADRYARAQLIVAGHGSIAPAVALRAMASQRGLTLDVPLAATYELEDAVVVLVVPTPDVALPWPPKADTIDAILRKAPPHSLVIPADALPPETAHADPAAFGYVMNVWENLHAPFLAMADACTDPKQKLVGYREAIRVDYACEFAHQRFAATAGKMIRRKA